MELEPQPILRAVDLAKTFTTGGRTITPFYDVSMSILEGEIVAILGTSGSGKSTLLHVLGGVDRPTLGTVEIHGTDLSTLTDTQLTVFRRSATGFVFQHFNLLPMLDVYENIALPFIIDGRDSQQFRERVEDLIELFGLRGREHQSITDLSAGEQQRIAVARAFLTEPSIVIADEPTGSLDALTGSELLQLMWESCDNFHQTILVTTQHPKVAAVADRVLVLNDGIILDEIVLGRRESHADAGPIVRRLEELGL